MQDAHWFFIFAAILITPFLPGLLRSKCPKCKKRKMQSLDTVKIRSEDSPSHFTYVTLYRCDACRGLFKRTKSGSLMDSTADEHRMFTEAGVHGT